MRQMFNWKSWSACNAPILQFVPRWFPNLTIDLAYGRVFTVQTQTSAYFEEGPLNTNWPIDENVSNFVFFQTFFFEQILFALSIRLWQLYLYNMVVRGMPFDFWFASFRIIVISLRRPRARRPSAVLSTLWNSLQCERHKPTRPTTSTLKPIRKNSAGETES